MVALQRCPIGGRVVHGSHPNGIRKERLQYIGFARISPRCGAVRAPWEGASPIPSRHNFISHLQYEIRRTKMRNY